MSFQEERNAISICNKALSRIAQAPLSGSLTDAANQAKHSARECARWYPAVVRKLLEQHHWGIATKRVALALEAVNTRSAEWGYAYAKPSDMAFPVAIGPWAGTNVAVSYYRGLGYLLASLYGQPMFRYQGGTLYSQIASGELEYVSFDITEADFTETFESVVVLYLAAQLARSVAKDESLGQSYDEQGLRALNLAIAQELNAGGARYDHSLSEGELVRDGGAYDPRLAGLYR